WCRPRPAVNELLRRLPELKRSSRREAEPVLLLVGEPFELGGCDQMGLRPDVAGPMMLPVIVDFLGEVRSAIRQFGEPSLDELQRVLDLHARHGAELLLQFIRQGKADAEDINLTGTCGGFEAHLERPIGSLGLIVDLQTVYRAEDACGFKLVADDLLRRLVLVVAKEGQRLVVDLPRHELRGVVELRKVLVTALRQGPLSPVSFLIDHRTIGTVLGLCSIALSPIAVSSALIK